MSDRPSADDVLAVYERQADRFAGDRRRDLVEGAWLTRFADLVPAGGRVLDLGCGTGTPIAGWLLERGFDVVGLDGSPAMLERARTSWPAGDWRLGDLRTFELGQTVDGIVAWNSVFHLRPDEQEACLGRIARHLAPAGALLMTIGSAAGETTGRVGDEFVHHASLGPDRDVELLTESGVQLVDLVVDDPTCGRHSVLLARRP